MRPTIHEVCDALADDACYTTRELDLIRKAVLRAQRAEPTPEPPHGEEASVTDRQLLDLTSRWRFRATRYRATFEPNRDQAQRNEGLAAGHVSAAIDLENLLRGEPLRG